MKKKTASIILIFIIVFVFIAIALMNFLVDPYKVFIDKDFIDFNNMPKKYTNIMLKAYKNHKSDTLIIGGSEPQHLYNDIPYFYTFYFNCTSIMGSTFEEQYILLKNYLYLHPETKNVYLFLSYAGFNTFSVESKDEIQNNNYNLDELIFLFFSKDITKKSIKQIINNPNYYSYRIRKLFLDFLPNIKNKEFKEIINQKKAEKYFQNMKFIHYAFPKMPPTKYDSVELKKRFLDKFQENIISLEKSIQLLKENNINFIIVITPNHAISQAIIYSDPDIQTKIEIFKKFCVDNSNNEVYDFSVINEYTTTEYPKHWLFSYYSHANFIYGLKIFKVLHDNISENGLYLKLNKKNFDKQMKYERKLIKEYIDKNKNLLEKYNNWEKYHPQNEDVTESKMINLENAPDYIQKEIDLYKYNFKKINENYITDNIKTGNFSNKFYTKIEN